MTCLSDRLSVRSSMVLLVVLLGLPMIGMIAYSVQKNREEAIVESVYLLNRFTVIEADGIERTLDESRFILQKLAQMPDIQALDPKRCPPLLGNIKHLFPRYANVAVINADGTVVCSVTPTGGDRPVSVGAKDWFAQASKSDGFSISPPHRGSLTNKWVLGLNHPIRDNAGRFAGLVGYSLDLRYQSSLPRLLPLPEGLVLVMVDRQGTVILDSRNDSDALGKQFSDTLAMTIGPGDRQAGTRVIGTGDDEQLVAVTPVGNTGFRLYGVWPTRHIAQGEGRNGFYQLTFVTMLAGLSIMLALIIGRRFSLQIEKMASAVGLVAKGDLSWRIPAKGPTELVELAQGFNHMLDVRLQAEARYRSLFEASSDGVVVVDTRSMIILANSRAHQIFGYAPGELICQDLGILIPECGRSLHAQLVEQSLAYPVKGRMTDNCQGRRKNGELFKCEVNRFQRVVHDVSREIGKDIRLVVNGEETELDKTVIEKIADPLTHLVRNAIDHGIEPAELRAARGKPVQGTVRLNAYHDSGSIVIEVSDDGGGLKRDKILAKAIERGLVEPGRNLSDAEICNLNRSWRPISRAASAKVGMFDVIFLRNVMIYFNGETKRQVVGRVLSLLRQGGLFIIGHSETLNDVTDAVEGVMPSVYRKR